ncbi:hypothetical protein MMC19_004295 [Ptychographa xylographoides]|nr:hypothetical protein [Ptychographa xylographoides]
MVKSASKRVLKSNSTQVSATPTKGTEPPAPYSTAPSIVLPFLETLDPKHVYIVHIDDHPKALKKRIFVVPVLMNIGIIGFLLWRAYVAIPYYVALLMNTLGYDTIFTVDLSGAQWTDLFDIAMGRAFMFFIDFALIKFVAKWPIEFFIGFPGNPVSWRRTVGFQEEEIVVRRSRRWDETLPSDWLAEEADGTVYKERILPAISKKWIRAKTSYLMMDKNWDLDFAGMTTAHDLVEGGKNVLSDFSKTVIVHHEEHGWLTWHVWKLDEGSEEEARKKIVVFKDKLTAMGKENLFFSWVELIQFETSQPGGFTKDRQAKTMERAKELFEAQGVDFDQFWKEIGGVQGLPGMELHLEPQEST